MTSFVTKFIEVKFASLYFDIDVANRLGSRHLSTISIC